MCAPRASRPLALSALLLSALPFLSAAAPPAAEPPDDLIRRANAAFTRGDADAADALYSAAEERTGDPGLVAFNKAAVLFQKGEFWAAEAHYTRALDDRECPPGRAGRAWFNRGTCLLRRGGSAGVYRSAVACFEHCLELDTPDDTLKADARHNLELAKLLWAEANRKAAKPENPNVAPPEEQLDQPPPPTTGTDPDQMNPSEGDGSTGSRVPRMTPQPTPTPVPREGSPRESTTPTPGNNPALQVLQDSDKTQPLSPDETREYLRQTDERLRRERQGLLRTLSGPERAGIKDW